MWNIPSGMDFDHNERQQPMLYEFWFEWRFSFGNWDGRSRW